ncbi:MAG: transaldolase [Candidatus Doudnabacteria bacterium]|nr:transaldolase [Candidatus Doudnabacteria bacterium]
MRPANLKTRIFLDSGDPDETREALGLLGFFDGQTTNPSLIAKNPETAGKKFTREEILDFYKKVVQEISGLIPEGSVSIEVYADFSTPGLPTPSSSPPSHGGEKRLSMLEQARGMFHWIPNGHIKFPTTTEGLKAAEQAVKEGMGVNMTLCFSQEQAAAVYAATRGAQRGQVFVSPFVGRLDDRGERGMDLIANIIKMYKQGDGHVEVLTASVRNIEHVLEALRLGSDIITMPLGVLENSKSQITNPKQIPNFPPKADPPLADKFQIQNLKPIDYKELDLDKSWQEYDIGHELTDIGMEKFSEDWNRLIK